MIFHTIMEMLKALFFNETLKRWHFEELVKQSKLSRERVNFYLNQFQKANLIKRIKEKNKMPYYLANRDSLRFRFEKREYGLNKLQGLIEHISASKGVKTAILFGSFARGDWSASSDIDIFIFGNMNDFNKAKFEKDLNREIHLFAYEKKESIRKDLDEHLFPNIIRGVYIKDELFPFEVIVNA